MGLDAIEAMFNEGSCSLRPRRFFHGPESGWPLFTVERWEIVPVHFFQISPDRKP